MEAATKQLDFLELCKTRRSIRKYKKDEVPQHLLEKVIEAGKWAPSGHNDQSWFFIVVQNKEVQEIMSLKTKEQMSQSTEQWMKNRGLDGGYHLFYHAPVVIVIAGKASTYSSLIDCTAATQNMLLMAHSLGLGCCWIGLVNMYFSLPESRETLKIPDGYTAYYAITVGFPDADTKPRIPDRKGNDCIWL